MPANVQSVLAARIDRLAEREKTVLADGGGDRQGVLRAGAGAGDRVWTGASFEDALRHLVAGEFVYEQELYPEVLYAFKHPLTQEVAYESQLADRRAALHAAVARALTEETPSGLTRPPRSSHSTGRRPDRAAGGGSLERGRRRLGRNRRPEHVVAALAQGARAHRHPAGIG